MKDYKKMSIWLILFIFLIVGSYALFLSRSHFAPNVSFKTIANKNLKLDYFKGKPVLVTFWASNCPSCLKEIEIFKNIYQKYHQRGLNIIAIAMSYDRPNYVINTQKKYQIPYHIVLDLKGDLASAFDEVSLIPTTFLLNNKGKIVFQITGFFDLVAMEQRIEILLRETESRPSIRRPLTT